MAVVFGHVAAARGQVEPSVQPRRGLGRWLKFIDADLPLRELRPWTHNHQCADVEQCDDDPLAPRRLGRVPRFVARVIRRLDLWGRVTHGSSPSYRDGRWFAPRLVWRGYTQADSDEGDRSPPDDPRASVGAAYGF